VPLPAHEWAPQELVVINEPRENILRVRVILADPAHTYDKVIATLRYEQADRVVEQPLELRNHADVFDWAVRLENPAERDWTYQATLIKRSGDIDNIPWTDGKNEQLILGVRAVDVLQIQVAWLIQLPAGDLIAVKVDTVYDDAPNGVHWVHSELIRQGHSGMFTWVVPIMDATKRAFQYKVTEFRSTGQKEMPWLPCEDLTLVLMPST